MDRAGGDRLPALHQRLRRLVIRHRLLGGDEPGRAALLGLEQPGRDQGARAGLQVAPAAGEFAVRVCLSEKNAPIRINLTAFPHPELSRPTLQAHARLLAPGARRQAKLRPNPQTARQAAQPLRRPLLSAAAAAAIS